MGARHLQGFGLGRNRLGQFVRVAAPAPGFAVERVAGHGRDGDQRKFVGAGLGQLQFHAVALLALQYVGPADRLAIRAGLTTRSDVAMRRGTDAETIDRVNAEDNARATALDLSYDSDTRVSDDGKSTPKDNQ